MIPRFHRYAPEDTLPTRRQLDTLRRREAAACDMIKRFVSAHSTVLALSFGKDSMTLLELCRRAEVLDGIVVMWNNSGLETPDTLEFRDYVVGRYDIPNYEETEPDAGTLDRTLGLVDLSSPHPTRDFVYECLERPRWAVMDKHDIDGSILGLRGDESEPRAITIATKGLEYWNKREKADILLPIGNWSTREVFRYLAWRNVPIHPIYLKMSDLGFDRFRVRLNTPVSVISRQYGQIAALRRLYPQTYLAYVKRQPDIRSFA